jgi:hypothetical protein
MKPFEQETQEKQKKEHVSAIKPHPHVSSVRKQATKSKLEKLA